MFRGQLKQVESDLYNKHKFSQYIKINNQATCTFLYKSVYEYYNQSQNFLITPDI